MYDVLRVRPRLAKIEFRDNDPVIFVKLLSKLIVNGNLKILI